MRGPKIRLFFEFPLSRHLHASSGGCLEAMLNVCHPLLAVCFRVGRLHWPLDLLRRLLCQNLQYYHAAVGRWQRLLLRGPSDTDVRSWGGQLPAGPQLRWRVERMQQRVHPQLDDDCGPKRQWRRLPGCAAMRRGRGRLPVECSNPVCGSLRACELPGGLWQPDVRRHAAGSE